jgi:thioredoxin reductase
MKDNDFDVIIIGGSYAGLSAAMALGRSIRKVLIIDSGNPCNKQAPRSHNFITWDGSSPSSIAEKAKKEVLLYPTIKFLSGIANGLRKTDSGFEAIVESGEKFNARKLLFATGVTDIIPDIEGFSKCWGISILHCPYCHGYEERGKFTAALANGENAMHLCMVLLNLTKDIILLTNGKPSLTENQLIKLNSHRIQIIDTEVIQIKHQHGQIESICFKNGECLNVPVMYAKIPFRQQCLLAENLGCEITEEGFIKVDESKRTTVHGIYAAGDNTTVGRTISRSIAAGTVAGMMLNGEMALESF